METQDPFATTVTEESDPFAGQSLEEMADPAGFGESPESELVDDANAEPPSAVPPVVDREGNPVVDPTPQAASAGPTDAPADPTPGSSTPSPTEPAPAVAEAPAEAAPAVPAPGGEAVPVEAVPSQAQAAPEATGAPDAGVATPETAEALPAAPAEAPPTPVAPAGKTGSTTEPAKPKKAKAKAKAKADNEGPRRYRALYQTAQRTWEELPLNTEAAKEVEKNIVPGDDGDDPWIESNNVDQARRTAYICAGRPRDGIRLVLVAEKSWQPKTVKPRVVPTREALDIS